jgi:hypothetical protein
MYEFSRKFNQWKPRHSQKDIMFSKQGALNYQSIASKFRPFVADACIVRGLKSQGNP